MKSIIYNGKKLGLFFLFLILSTTFLFSQKTKSEKNEIHISEWLYSGNVPVQLPVYHQEPGVNGNKYEYADIMKFDQIDPSTISPKEGNSFTWENKRLKWKTVKANKHNNYLIPKHVSEMAEIAYLATYVNADEWTTASLEIKTPYLFNLYVDGKLLKSKLCTDKESDEENLENNVVMQELKLESGKHLVMLKLLKEPSKKHSWNISAKLEVFIKNKISISTSPLQFVNLEHVLHADVPYNVSISPDGQIAALSISNSIIQPDDKENWLELRSIKNGELLQTFRGGMNISNINWAPQGNKFAYASVEKNKSTLWLMDMNKGTTEYLLKDMGNFGGYTWAPDGSFIIYSVSEDPVPEKSGVHRLDGMADRLPGYKSRSFLYKLDIKYRTKARLTSGELSTFLYDISPAGNKILFTRSYPDYSVRDYSVTGLYIMDLNTMQVDSLWSGQWFSSAQWSPDGKKLLITGGPSMFGKLGINVPEGRIPNDYDTQAYLYELSSGNIEPISWNFDPQVKDAYWSKVENAIYFSVTDRSSKNLYRYDIKTKKYKKINTGMEIINQVDFARNKPVAVCYGSGANMPFKIFTIDLKKNKSRELLFPAQKDFENVLISEVKRWTFKNKQGDIIEGRVHYPPDFDPDKKYPAIVYYYAGTSPVTRDFGGRYPKNYWAANGYVVYVLQPSGATGFGQEFSSRHVNDWGLTTADEIILGTKEFLKAHPFVDEKKVGCLGASYGGFMTMLLATKTDIYAAAISHAGISSLASYWGEGYWGYTYSAVATANSFPWNKKDFYVEQGALYNADKINTPMLLLHGMSDTNVPPGESIQLYTALKLLGKDVEFVQVEGQNHWILKFNKRVKWSKTIVAYFDKYLKELPGWWNEMYGE